MKLVRIKGITSPVKCSFCKQRNKTLHRIQGYPHYGATCCKECYKIEKAKYDEQAAREAQHEQTDAEWMLRV